MVATFHFAPDRIGATLAGAVIVIWLLFLFSFHSREDSSRHVAFSITALVYAGLILGLIVPLHASPLGPWWVILTMVTTWASDTGAYFGGSQFGSRALYPDVSPNKSVEGSIAGILASLIGFAVCNWAIFPALASWTPLAWWLSVAIVILGNLLAQSGDLAESLIKRAHDVDDSGRILYGHGGILDRIDGLIFAVPWFYLCAVYGLPALGLSP
jgi:phosphatidate cytidylyltransferase